MIARLFYRLTGGRPMHYEGPAFRDIVSGRYVTYYRCRLGVRYMAENPWALFRVRTEVQ